MLLYLRFYYYRNYILTQMSLFNQTAYQRCVVIYVIWSKSIFLAEVFLVHPFLEFSKKGLSKSVSKYELCIRQRICTSKTLVTLILTLMFCCQQGGTWVFIQDAHIRPVAIVAFASKSLWAGKTWIWGWLAGAMSYNELYRQVLFKNSPFTGLTHGILSYYY